MVHRSRTRTENKYTPMMNFVKKIASPGKTFLIPGVKRDRDFKIDDFRLYTGALTFVDFKSHPYKDKEVIEWYKRIQIARAFYESEDELNCKILEELSANYGVTHVVLENNHIKGKCNILHELYKDDNFGVFEINF